MKMLNKQNLILNRQIQNFSVCLTKGVGERACRVLLFFLVGGYMKDSLKGSMINFQDFQVQGSFQACPIFTPLWVISCQVIQGMSPLSQISLKF